MKRLFTQFSFPGGIPSHVAPETPGSIHEGGELGYALSHAYGAAFDNPDLIVACVVGDGEAETGPLATSWHSNKFLNPVTDGVVLPILHLNGYKIANPTVLARISHEELDQLFRGYGYTPHFVEGHEPDDDARADGRHPRRGRSSEIQRIKADARREGLHGASALAHDRAPHAQGLDRAPKEIDGKRTEDYWRSHQVPMGEMHDNPAHVRLLEAVDEELPARGALRRRRPAPARAGRPAAPRPPPHERQPAHQRRHAAPRPAPAGFPRLRGRRSPAPGAAVAESTRVMGRFLRDVMKLNLESRNFRLFSPGREQLEPLAGRARGHRPRLGRGDASRGTTTSPPTGG